MLLVNQQSSKLYKLRPYIHWLLLRDLTNLHFPSQATVKQTHFDATSLQMTNVTALKS